MPAGLQQLVEEAALALFLDRLYGGVELSKEFHDPEMKIIPHGRRKIVVRMDNDG